MTTSDSLCDHEPKVRGQFCVSNGYSLIFSSHVDLKICGNPNDSFPSGYATARKGRSSSFCGSPR